MKIGIIGTGNIGGVVGALLAEAGHEIVFGSRHPEHNRALIENVENARVVTIEEAATEGELVICAVPYGKWPELAPKIADAVAGKIVIDAANPNVQRDGDYARHALDDPQGSGRRVAALLPDAKLVRSFSTIESHALARGAHKDGAKLGLPVAGDDRDARDIAAKLVADAGFAPVIVGELDEAKRFDTGAEVYNSGMTGDEVRAALSGPRPS